MRTLLLLLLIGCNAKPYADGECNSAGIDTYRRWPNDDSGAIWCKYDGYWWECTLDGSTCHRKAKLPAEDSKK